MENFEVVTEWRCGDVGIVRRSLCHHQVPGPEFEPLLQRAWEEERRRKPDVELEERKAMLRWLELLGDDGVLGREGRAFKPLTRALKNIFKKD